MDDFEPTVFGSPNALGILYAEDFELDPAPASPEPEPEPVAPAGPPPLTRADIDAACQAAVSAARADWAHDAQERRAVALAVMSVSLAEARDAAALAAEAAMEALAVTVLAMLAAMLPELCRSHGDREVQALLGRLLPMLGRARPVVVRVHAGLIPALQADLAAVDESLLESVDFRPANLPPGDTRLSWENGTMLRDQAAIRTALEEALAQFGLLPSTPQAAPDRAPETHLNRSLTLAE